MLPPDHPIGHDCTLPSPKFTSGALGQTLVTTGGSRDHRTCLVARRRQVGSQEQSDVMYAGNGSGPT